MTSAKEAYVPRLTYLADEAREAQIAELTKLIGIETRDGRMGSSGLAAKIVSVLEPHSRHATVEMLNSYDAAVSRGVRKAWLQRLLLDAIGEHIGEVRGIIDDRKPVFTTTQLGLLATELRQLQKRMERLAHQHFDGLASPPLPPWATRHPTLNAGLWAVVGALLSLGVQLAIRALNAPA